MILIAISGTTRAEWVIAHDHRILEYAETNGLNPYFKSRREISHIVRLELPEAFFKKRWDHVFFYGSGCATQDKNKIVETSLTAQFRTRVYVSSDLQGTARGLLHDKRGMACIMSTGTSTCFYDGIGIIKNVKSGGYLLGDEGSCSDLGRRLLGDVLKELPPRGVLQKFYEKYRVTPERLVCEVYESQSPQEVLSRYSTFLYENIGTPYCHDLVYRAFMDAFSRNLVHYDYKNYGLSVAGRVVALYRDVLFEAAKDFGVEIVKAEPSAIQGLVEYHT